MNKQWVEDAKRALDNFTVVSLDNEGVRRRIEAHADTGSRYVVYAVTADRSSDGGEWLIVVRRPWAAMYEIQDTGYMTPDYFLEHWAGGMTGHGGDTYAILECIRQLLGDGRTYTPIDLLEQGLSE